LPYTLCDVNEPGNEQEEFDLTTRIQEIITGQEGMDVTFHQTMADAQGDINALDDDEAIAYTNQGGPVETLFVRVENADTGCYRVVLLDIRVEPLPMLTEPDPDEDLVVCDPDGDGFATFDLVALAETLLNDGNNIALSFYETQQNAIDGEFPIQDPENFTNVVAFNQPLYVVAENTVTGCRNVVPFGINIQIIPSPEMADLEDLVLCDEDASNQNGATVFDLTQQDPILLESLPGTAEDYYIYYFTSLANAELGTPRITNPGTFNGSNGQQIWVRVEDKATECFGITSFMLEVQAPLALTTPPMFTICNSALPNDAIETFDLTTQYDIILGPQGVGQGYTVEFFETEQDRENGIAIPNPESYENEVFGVQTLYVTVTTDEGCRSYTTLTIKVLPLPEPNTEPEALVACDDNASPDGLEFFDLTDAEADIRDNDNTLVLSYHATLGDAEADINPIADPTNYESATGTVYVRVEATTNNPANPVCYIVVDLQLIVNPLPALGDAGVIDPYAICEQLTDGYAIFNLNTYNDEVLGGADTTGYGFTYFRSLADAQANTNAIPLAGYQNEVQNQQPVWVVVENEATGCTITGTFDLLVELEAVANTPENDAICDDDDGVNDGIATYNLTQFTAEVLGTQPEGPGQYIVEYYTEDPELNPDATPIADLVNFRNEGSPDVQDIYIRVYNDGTISKCSDYTMVTIEVERLVVPVLEGGTICVDYNTLEVIRTHTLTSGVDASYSFKWYKDGQLIAGATGPDYEVTAPGSYSVIATSILGCESLPITPVTVLQSGPPAAVGTGYTVSNYFSDEQVITINVEGFGEYEYKLDDGPWQESNIFTGVDAGPHQVQIRDASADNPCSEFILTLEGVSIVDYPKYFTPNGDGYHDTWNITGFGDDNTDAKIYIFDRYGKLVKQISSQGEGWNGTMNGSELPATDYWFRVIYRETVEGVPTIKEYKAHFSLKR
jgi:valyl-tRNA synthetase